MVAADLSLHEAHAVAEEAQHRLLHEVPKLTAATVHYDPEGATHATIADHGRAAVRAQCAAPEEQEG